MIQTYNTATIDKHELDRLIEQADRQAAQQGYLSRTTSFNGEVMTVEWHKALAADIKAKLTNDVQPKRVVVRAIVEGQEAKKELMAAKIEIKGLAGIITDARKAIADAKAAPSELFNAVTALKADCQELTGQVKALHSDLLFEASQLGNAGPASEESDGKSTN